MATCPKCQLPNPEAVETCIWCGGYRFESANVPAKQQPEPAISALIECAAPVAGASAVLNLAPQTPNTPAPEPRPIPAHVAPLLAPAPQNPVTPLSSELRTVAATPMALAMQQAVATPPPSETVVPKVHVKLLVLRGQKVAHEYPLYEGRNIIGRFAERPVDIDLVAQEAEGQIWSSRQHAAVILDRGAVLLEDLNSLNGTWVNGSRMHAGMKRPMKANDVIQIGTVQLKVVIT